MRGKGTKICGRATDLAVPSLFGTIVVLSANEDGHSVAAQLS